MKSLKVNADYETVLFHGNSGPKMVNESIEFLSLFLEPNPLLSSKKYSKAYLSYVKELIGNEPRIQEEGDYQNWWGSLKNIELEKKINSKITSSEFIVLNKWCANTYILTPSTDLGRIPWDRSYLLKDPTGMSGQKFKVVTEAIGKVERGSFILEPLFHRVYDFSHYVFPDGKTIAYQNFVDSKFQYKGTIFQNRFSAEITDLNFYSLIKRENWVIFKSQLKEIIEYYRSLGAKDGFSIDSFVYLEEGELKIRILSEVNYRRTMGLVAYDLAQKFAANNSCTLFILTKTFSFEEMKNKLVESSLQENVLILSPGDTRFGMLFLFAMNSAELAGLVHKLQDLLPTGEFPIKI